MEGSTQPDREIQNLVDLISNTTEAYTTALFVAPSADGPLSLHAYQSLSKNIDEDVQIGPGEGLIGWVHKNKQAVNVDQFDRDTRRLLFYRTDESIKSFMAVPLLRVNGVLAVDSKQRYVFSDKSQKILHQFGQTLELTLERVTQAHKGLRVAGALAFLTELEQLLVGRDQEGQAINRTLSLLRHYAGAEACFLAASLRKQPGHFVLLAHDTDQEIRLNQEAFTLDQGLAGWVMSNQKTLIVDRGHGDGERSFLFHPDEPLKRLPGFCGLPALYAGRLRGAILFGSVKPFQLDPIRLQGLEAAANRIAAALEMEFLFQRLNELGRLDPQVGLPHRSFFIKRTNRLLKMAEVKGHPLTLLLVQLTNLGEVAQEYGQDSAQEALRACSRLLLGNITPDQELGHVSYGIFVITLIRNPAEESARLLDEIKRELTDRPLEKTEGRLRLKIRSTTAHHPTDGRTAEELLSTGLARIGL